MPKPFRMSYRDKATGEARQSKTYFARVVHADGVRRKVRLSPNLAAARVMLSALLADIENQKASPAGPAAAAARKPLAEHVADWCEGLAAAGATPKHVRQMAAAARKVFDGCFMLALADISESAVRRFVAALRQSPPSPRRRPLPATPRPNSPACWG